MVDAGRGRASARRHHGAFLSLDTSARRRSRLRGRPPRFGGRVRRQVGPSRRHERWQGRRDRELHGRGDRLGRELHGHHHVHRVGVDVRGRRGGLHGDPGPPEPQALRGSRLSPGTSARQLRPGVPGRPRDGRAVCSRFRLHHGDQRSVHVQCSPGVHGLLHLRRVLQRLRLHRKRAVLVPELGGEQRRQLLPDHEHLSRRRRLRLRSVLLAQSSQRVPPPVLGAVRSGRYVLRRRAASPVLVRDQLR